MEHRTKQLTQQGQSLWLDYIHRRELQDGTLARLVEEDGVCGVTSNPTIFMNAVSKSSDYDAQIGRLYESGMRGHDIYSRITMDDIRGAGELLLPVFETTGGRDGFVSIELNPEYAFRVDESISEARSIVAELALPNIMVKVPGTLEGLKVIGQLVREGINVNVTLLFSPERYRRVALTYIDALQARAERGDPVGDVHSVASFFISRIDTRVDTLLDAGCAGAQRLRGTAAVQTAKITYGLYRELFSEGRFAQLQAQGAGLQRVLWASTGTKDPAYSDVKYVDELIGPDTINTLPPKTMAAFRDHGTVKKTIDEELDKASGILNQIRACGVDIESIYAELERDGVAAFEKSYRDLLAAIEEKGKALTA